MEAPAEHRAEALQGVMAQPVPETRVAPLLRERAKRRRRIATTHGEAGERFGHRVVRISQYGVGGKFRHQHRYFISLPVVEGWLFTPR